MGLRGLFILVHPLTQEVTGQLLWGCSSLGLKADEQIQSWYESRQGRLGCLFKEEAFWLFC